MGKEKSNSKKTKEIPLKKKRRVSLRFASILAIVSIIGFLDIIMDSFFELSF